ncbi:hypothetical protein [Bradyrhizobium elkanii]|uniref:hypothetical protein n=1 Tax=Bradyrhizobium elkanii TaxID=29448 RepID=UPI003517D98A
MFPGGRRRAGDSERKCLRREITEELPKLRLGDLRRWKEVNGKNRLTGRSSVTKLERSARDQCLKWIRWESDRALKQHRLVS